jgi:hypothetical protein
MSSFNSPLNFLIISLMLSLIRLILSIFISPVNYSLSGNCL